MNCDSDELTGNFQTDYRLIPRTFLQTLVKLPLMPPLEQTASSELVETTASTKSQLPASEAQEIQIRPARP